MQLARFLNKLFKKDGFILVDADSRKHIIGLPEKKKPITIRILNRKQHYKLLVSPNLNFGEAYSNEDILI